jgi:hypothetical protein
VAGEHVRRGLNAGRVEGLNLLRVPEDFVQLAHERAPLLVGQLELRKRGNAIDVGGGQGIGHKP